MAGQHRRGGNVLADTVSSLTNRSLPKTSSRTGRKSRILVSFIEFSYHIQWLRSDAIEDDGRSTHPASIQEAAAQVGAKRITILYSELINVSVSFQLIGNAENKKGTVRARL